MVVSLHEPYPRHIHPHSVIARTWSVGNFGFGDSPESPLDRHSRHRTLTPHGRSQTCGANKMRPREISSRNGTPHTVRAFRAKAGKCHLEPSAPRPDRKRWQGTAGIPFLNRVAIGRGGSTDTNHRRLIQALTSFFNQASFHHKLYGTTTTSRFTAPASQ